MSLLIPEWTTHIPLDQSLHFSSLVRMTLATEEPLSIEELKRAVSVLARVLQQYHIHFGVIGVLAAPLSSSRKSNGTAARWILM